MDERSTPSRNGRLVAARLRLLSPSGSGRPMSRQELADAVNAYLWGVHGERAGVDASYVGKLEIGRHRWPRARYREAFREVLGAGSDAELGFFIIRGLARVREPARSSPNRGYGMAPPPVGLEFAANWRIGIGVAVQLWREDMRRREVLHGVGFSAAAFLPPAMRWLMSSMDERPTGSGERLVGEPDVEMLRRITATFRTLDNRFGGGHTRDSMVRFLHGDVVELLAGRYDPATGRALLSAVAETTQLAAWASYDAGMHGLAQRYLIQALRLAAGAGDRALGAEILAAMSHQAAYLRASSEAVDLARAAGRAAADAGIAAIRAEAAVLEAQGLAVGGDEAGCTAALTRAEQIFDRADRTSDPQWIGYFDEAYLAAKFGHCFTALGRGDLARRFALRSLDMDGQQYARGRQFNLALLAVAHAQAAEPEEAARVGLQAVAAAEGLSSSRARDYLADLANRLAKHVGLPAVRDFTDRAHLVLQG